MINLKFMMTKPSHAGVMFIIIGLGFCLPIFFFVTGFIGYGLIFSAFMILATACIIAECQKHLIIDEHGVKYVTLFKRYEMTWDEIKIIGIGYVPPGNPCIYFTADTISMARFHHKMINERFLMIAYRKKVLEAIRKHWNGTILTYAAKGPN